MRCPKCQYISFDSGDRCRNCGYEFSLTSGTRALDLPIQTGDEPIGPLGDLALDVPPPVWRLAPCDAAGNTTPTAVSAPCDCDAAEVTGSSRRTGSRVRRR